METADPARALRAADGPVLLDCLGTWLTACLDELDAWQRPPADWQAVWRIARPTPSGAGATPTWSGDQRGRLGVVPEHRSGRLFADLLGRLNQQVAAVSDEVVLMVMGRPIVL